ncbi:MAG TPA: hypothetical protein DDY20_10230 [Desulfobulbaceae bacterium]|nr:hypothetical protein [Desulfobulbaceae bacterium]
MADYFINIFLNDEKIQKLTDAGLAGNIKEIDGKKAIQVKASDKEQKKMVKGFPGLAFDANNACVLPEAAENTVFDIVCNMKTIDVMKFAIMKIYNPLAGKAPRTALG